DEMAETTIIKDARSLEHLLDKTSLFLHLVGAKLGGTPAAHAPPADPSLAGKKILIVDDDARNVFALTSKLERWEVIPLRAENGRQALEILKGSPGIDLVLMDIMMPE